MTEVAAVAGQSTVKQPGTGKGAAKGAANVLDGAFAVIFGKAGTKSETGDSAFATLAGKATTPDAELLTKQKTDDATTLGTDAAVVTVKGEAELDGLDPATGKSRKSNARGKANVDQSDAQAALVAAGVTVPQAADATAAKTKDTAKDGVAALDSATQGSTGASMLKLLAATSGADAQALAQTSGKPAGDEAKGARAAKAQPQQADAIAANAAPTNINTQTADRSGDQSKNSDSRSDKSQDRVADAKSDAANDDVALAASTDPLADIMNSLPPVLQSQLTAPVDGASAAGTVASAGQLLSNHAIDMSASGQWIDRMAQEIAKLADGTGHSSFQLSPPNLGKIQVDLWQGDDKTNVRVLAETDEAARRLREGQGALEAHARLASLSLGSVSVEKASASTDSNKDNPNQRQNADPNSNPNQQSFAQTQGQNAQGRGNSSGNLNRSGPGAVIGSERQTEPDQDARATRASDPRVRFA